MSWKCSCGVINSGINERCAAINHYRSVEHKQASSNTLDYLMMLKAERDFKNMTTNEDKFAQFFNNETLLIASMSEIERIEHIQELEEIAFEAKARLTAAKNYDRDQKAKKRLGGEWTISPTEPDQTVTDSIKKVELRRQRMTKLDKTKARLIAAGIDLKDVETMISAMTKAAVKSVEKASEKNGNNGKDSAKADGVTQPNNESKTVSLVNHESVKLDLSTVKLK